MNIDKDTPAPEVTTQTIEQFQRVTERFYPLFQWVELDPANLTEEKRIEHAVQMALPERRRFPR